MAPDPLLQRADRRWRELETEQPQLGPAIALQRTLIGRSIGALRQLERGPEAQVSFPHPYLRAKLARGVPALRGETIPPAVDLLGPLLGEFADLLASGGGGDPPAHIREALDAGAIEPSSWLAAVLARDRTRVLRGALQMGLAPDLLWLIGELAAAPLAHLLARTALSTVDDTGTPLGDDVSIWSRGGCPACGSWPALVEADGTATRRLRCSFCGSAWQLAERRCLYCGGAWLDQRTPDPGHPDRSLDLCTTCRGYVKVVVVPAPLVFPLASLEDLATTALDVAAMDLGYVRPPLPDEDRDADAANGDRGE